MKIKKYFVCHSSSVQNFIKFFNIVKILIKRPPQKMSYRLLSSVFILIFLISLSACKNQNSKNLKNPFTFKKTGLPHQTSFCGVGLPDLINSDLAGNVIDKVFKNNGFKITKNYLYQNDKCSFIIDSYDETQKIGYVYLTYNNLEDDSIIPWDYIIPFQIWVLNHKTKKGETKEEKELRLFDKWLDEENVSDFKFRISFLNKHLLKIEKQLIDSVGKSNNKNFLRKAYTTLRQKQKEYTLSLDEVKRTIENNGKDGIFIAVISIYDKNLAVYPDYEREIEEQLAGNDSTIKKMSGQYTQEDALNYLKKSADEYIAWAKSKI